MATEFGNLGGDTCHHHIDRQPIVGTDHECVLVADQTARAQVVRGVNTPENPLEQRRDQVVTPDHSSKGKVEIGDSEITADRRHSGNSHQAEHAEVFCGHSSIGHRGEVVGQGWQPVLAPAGGEPVDKGVCCAVIGLTRITQGRRGRRHQDKMVEINPFGGTMQIERTMSLWRKHVGDGFCGQVCQEAVIQHACEVEYTLERLFQVGDTPANIFLVGNVALHQVDFDPLTDVRERRRLAQPILAAPAFRITVHEGEVPSAGGCEVRKESLAETSQSTRDEVGRFRVENRPPVDDRKIAIGRSGRRLQHKLTLVLARGHETKCLRVVTVASACPKIN